MKKQTRFRWKLEPAVGVRECLALEPVFTMRGDIANRLFFMYPKLAPYEASAKALKRLESKHGSLDAVIQVEDDSVERAECLPSEWNTFKILANPDAPDAPERGPVEVTMTLRQRP